MVEVATDIKTENSTETSNIIIRYGWGNEELKNWFITKTKKAFMPKGSRLLMILGCEPTSSPISISDTYPTVGDVAQDVDGNLIKIKTIDWV